MNAMPSKKDLYHARRTLVLASRQLSSKELAQGKAAERVEKRLAQLQTERGGRFYWQNGIIRQVTLHPTKGFRNARYGEMPAPLINGIVIQVEARGA